MSEENKIRDTVDAVTGLAKAVPVYQDIAQPAAQEVGKALQTVAKTIHLALAPVSAMVWGYEQIKEFVATKVTERLKNIPPENIISPKPNLAGPALEALRYTGHESVLSDMYANLLATSMDKATAENAHPAFVEIIRQLTPDEAKLVYLFLNYMPFPLLTVRKEYKTPNAQQKGGFDVKTNYSTFGEIVGCEFLSLMPTYLDNLCRLGLAEIPSMWVYMADGIYEPLEKSETITKLIEETEADGVFKAILERRGLRITTLGRQFARVCVQAKN